MQCVEAAKQLREDDVKVLSYIYQINVPSTCDTTLSKAIHVFESLEEDGRLRPNGGGEITLQTLLNELPRQDIVFQLFGETKEANVNTGRSLHIVDHACDLMDDDLYNTQQGCVQICSNRDPLLLVP